MAQKFVCTRCGNEHPHVYLRSRYPDPDGVFCHCLMCGASNWAHMQNESWAFIRYAEAVTA